MYQVSSNPHIRDKATTASIMRDVIIALIPAALFGIWNFGGMAALNIIVAVAAAVGAEWLFQYFTKQKITVKDLSAVVTGLLLALNVPADLPVWMTGHAGRCLATYKKSVPESSRFLAHIRRKIFRRYPGSACHFRKYHIA